LAFQVLTFSHPNFDSLIDEGHVVTSQSFVYFYRSFRLFTPNLDQNITQECSFTDIFGYFQNEWRRKKLKTVKRIIFFKISAKAESAQVRCVIKKITARCFKAQTFVLMHGLIALYSVL